MLIKGDLVRVPQSSILISAEPDSWKMKRLKTSEYGVVLSCSEDKCKILLNGNEWEVKIKDVKLQEHKSVC